MQRDSEAETEQTTHFGYEEIPTQEKTRRVADVFHSVADRYDLMNDLMSFGIHRLWKRIAILHCGVQAGHKVLDLASGTGDLAKHFAKAVGRFGHLVLSDINSSMLERGRDRLLNLGFAEPLSFLQANAECLPLADGQFDCVSIAFGLRNVTHPMQALKEMYRVIKPGGRLVILEFSKPLDPTFSKIYDAYSFNVLPLLGRLICNDAASYQYLAESIRKHPDQETLKGMLQEAGFERVDHENLTGGVVAIHKGFKF